MMKIRTSVVAVVLVVLAGCAGQAVAQGQAGGLVPPPAINIPYGGRIVTEVNISDADLLGVIKELIPQVGTIISSVGKMAPVAPGEAQAMEMASGLDFATLSKAISGITNVRVIAALYGQNMDRAAMLTQLDAGVVKAGKFRRIMSDVAMSQGLFAVYAQEDNKGYMAFAYDPKANVLYGARVVGFVDLPAITKWGFEAAKTFVGAIRVQSPALEPTTEPAPAPETAPEPATEEKQ